MSQNTYSILAGFAEMVVLIAGAAALVLAACVII